MRTLKFIVDGQILYKDKNCSFINIVKGSHNYLFLHFNFIGEEWTQYDKAVEFETKTSHKIVNFYGHTVGIPDEITSERIITIRLIGYKNKEVVFKTSSQNILQRG